MRVLPVLARAVALQIILASSIPLALANTSNSVETTIEAESTSDTSVSQESGSGSTQHADINGEAGLVIESNQLLDTTTDVDVDEECETGTGNQLCYSDASPEITNIAIQHIDATTQNDMSIDQTSGSGGSTQTATATGTALTDITASQSLTPTVIVDIFQDCTMQTGVCVQRSLPEVLTVASQVIAASALNNLNIDQQAENGESQQAIADVVAQVNVNAEQLVSPRTFLHLTQICAIDIGMCIQRALPVIQTVVEQVIEAQAHNNATVNQDGAEQQDASVVTAADTNVASAQAVDSQSTVKMFQRCGVKKGLCLQVDEYGNPHYVFSDGETTATGSYVGALDETQLQDEYSRMTVGNTARGICGGAGKCTMLEQLLFWLFGPEPIAPSVASDSFNRDQEGGSSSHRGKETNMLSASVRFLAQYISDEEVAPAAFGGFDDEEVDGTEGQKAVVCSMRTRLLNDQRPAEIWSWTARHIATVTGIPAGTAGVWLRDPLACPKVAAEQAEELKLNFFPIAADGPISSNPVWNACIRGEHLTLQEIRANTDRRKDGTPKTCASYHTQDSWYHPDLHAHFTWNKETGELVLPDGYVPRVQESL